MSSPFRVGRCVNWKVATNGHALVDQTACRSWCSGIVVDPWGRRRLRRSRFESGHQHHVQLLAGGIGAECPIAASCRSTVGVADGPGRVAWIPRILAGSAPADSRGAGEQATISAVLSAVRRSCPASCQQLQQLLRTVVRQTCPGVVKSRDGGFWRSTAAPSYPTIRSRSGKQPERSTAKCLPT